MEEICVLVAKDKGKVLKRYIYERKSMPELDVALNIYTVFCPKSLFTGRRLKKICSKYRYVYSDNLIFSKYCKRKEGSLLNFMPKLCLKKIANANNVNLAEENIGIVIKNNKFVNIKFLSELCKNIKYVRVYGSSRETNDLIMEASGICVQPGKDQNEKIIIYLDTDISFKVSGKIITDLRLSSYKDLLCDDIICDLLKCENAEKLYKKLKLNITEFV